MADPQVGTIAVGVDQSYLSRSVSSAILQGVRTAQVGNRGLKFNVDERSFRQPLGRITGDVNKFESSLAAANQRVITFGASAGIILGVVRGFQELISATIEVEKAFKDINSVFQLSSTDLNKFSRDLFDVARQTSQAFNLAAESAVEFSRQGLSAAETLRRVKDSLVLVRLSGLDAATAVSSLTAAVNGFARAGLNTTEIVNKLATVDAAFAVSSKDLAQALSRVGSTAQDAGVSFDELIGLITSAQQTTARGGAVIGNALKSIFTRIERRGTLRGLEDLGVEIRDLQGNVKPAIEVLKTLAKTYDSLGRAQQQQAAELVGGVFQINQLKAILGDLAKENSIFTLATQISTRAVDEATKRNEALNTTLSALIQNFSTTSKEIGSNFGDAIFAPLFRDIQSILGKGGLFNPLVESFKNIDTTDMGISFGEGILRGLGRVFGTEAGVPGPGLIAITAAFAKILSATASLAFRDMKSLFNIGNIKQDLSIQKGIETTLNSATDAERRRFMAARNNADQQRIILELLNRQVVASTQLAASNALFVRGLRTADPTLAKALTIVGAPRAAGGIIPAMAQEKQAVSRGVGGASASASPVLIPNFNFGKGKRGPVVANTDEYIVRNYAGSNASAIFNQEMVQEYGLPKGAAKIAAGGLVPNFARFYHGTSKRKIFENESGFRNSSRGIFLTTDSRMAGAYAMNFENDIQDYNRGRALNKTQNTRGRIIPVNADFKNTYKLSSEERDQYFFAHERGDPVAFQRMITKKARAKGHDSIDYGGNEYSYIDNPKNLIAGFSEGVVPNFARAGSARAIGQQAVLNSGGRIDSGRFSIPVTRRQKYAQAGNESVRGGVFYLPSSEKPSRFGYSNPATLYGGPQIISAQREFSSPFFVRAATGGVGPERAYSEAFGRKALKSLQGDVRDIVVSKALGPEYLQKIEGFISKYAPEKAGGNFASYLLNSSRQGNQLKYALQELAIGSAIKRRGNDAILSYGFQTGTKAPKLREVFALNEDKYPTSALGLIPNFSLNSRRRTLSEAIKSPTRIKKYTGTFDQSYQHQDLNFLSDLGDITVGEFLGSGAFKSAYALSAFKNPNARSISPLSTVALQSTNYNDKEFISDIFKLDQFSRIGAPVPKVFGRGREGQFGPESALVERVKQIDGYKHDLAGSTTIERNLSSNILNHILPFLSGFKTPSAFPGALGDIRAANLGISYKGNEDLVINILKELSKHKGLNPGLTKAAFDRGLKVIDVGYLQPKTGAKGIVPNFAAPANFAARANFDVNRGQRYENFSAFYLNTIQNKVAREAFSEELKKRVLSRQSPMFDTHALPNYLRGKGFPESAIKQMLERYEKNRNFSGVRVDALRGYTGTDIPTLSEINFSDIFDDTRYGFGMNPAEERFSYNALQGKRRIDRGRIFAARNFRDESGRGFVSPFGPESFLRPGGSLRLLDNTFTKIPMLGKAGGLIPNFKNEFFRGVRGPYSPFSFVGSPGTIFAARDRSIAKEYTRDANDYDNYHGSIGQFSIRKGTKIFNAVGRAGKQRLLKEILEPLGPDYARLLRSGGNKVFNLLDYSSVKQSLINKGYKGVHLDEYDRDAGYEYVGKSIALFDPKTIENQRVVDTLAKGTVPNALTRSDERIPRYASGFDPMALRQSLHREVAAGVPPSQVYIDQDSRLKGPANPAGLLVANRRDEPVGGFQGINRVIRQGGNPKIAGMAMGNIPNFADTPVQSLIGELNALSQALKKLTVITEQTRKASKEQIESGFDRRRKEDRGLKGSVGIIQSVKKSAAEKTNERFNLAGYGLAEANPREIKITDKGLRDVLAGVKFPKEFDPSDQFISKRSEERALQKDLTGLSFSQLAQVAGTKTPLDRRTRVNTIDTLRRGFNQPLATAQGVDRGQLGQIVRLQQSGTLETQFVETVKKSILSTPMIRGQQTFMRALETASKQFIAAGGSAKELERTVTGNLSGLQGFQAGVVDNRRGIAATARGIRIQDTLSSGKGFTDLSKRDQLFLRSQITNNAISDLGFQGTRKEVFANKEARRLVEARVQQDIATLPKRLDKNAAEKFQRSQARAQRFSSAALGLSFVGPLLSGFIPSGKGGTTEGKNLAALSGGIQGASSGALVGSFAGPIGIAVGAIAGGIAGSVAGFVSKSKKSFDELAREIEDANAKNAQSINAASQFGQIQQAISDTIEAGDLKQIDRLIQNQVSTLRDVDNPDTRRRLIGAQSGNEFSDILANIIKSADREARGRDIRSAAFRIREEKGAFSDFSGKSVLEFARTIAKASNLTAEELKEFAATVESSGSQALKRFAEKFELTPEQVVELTGKLGSESFTRGALRGAAEIQGDKERDASAFSGVQERRADIEISFRNEFKNLQLALERSSLARTARSEFGIANRDVINRAAIASDPISSEFVKLQKNNDQQLQTLIALNQNRLQTATETSVIELAAVLDKNANELGKDILSEIATTVLTNFRDTGGDVELLRPLIENKDLLAEIKQGMEKTVTNLESIKYSSRLAEEQLRISNRVNELSYRAQLKEQTLSGFRFDPDLGEKIQQARVGAASQFDFSENVGAKRISAQIDILNTFESAGLRPGDQSRIVRNNLQKRLVEEVSVNAGQQTLSDFIGADAFKIKEIGEIESRLKDIVTGKTPTELSGVGKEDRINIARVFLEGLEETRKNLGFDFESSLNALKKEFGEGVALGDSSIIESGQISIGEFAISSKIESLQTPLGNIVEILEGKANKNLLEINTKISGFLAGLQNRKEQTEVAKKIEENVRRIETIKEGVDLSGITIDKNDLSAPLAGLKQVIEKQTKLTFTNTSSNLGGRVENVKTEQAQFLEFATKKVIDLFGQNEKIDSSKILELFKSDEITGAGLRAGFNQANLNTIAQSLISNADQEAAQKITENTEELKRLRESNATLENTLKNLMSQAPSGASSGASSNTALPLLGGATTNVPGFEIPDLVGATDSKGLTIQALQSKAIAVLGATVTDEQENNKSVQEVSAEMKRIEGKLGEKRDELKAAINASKELGTEESRLAVVTAELSLNTIAGELAQLRGDRALSFKTGMNEVFLEYKRNMNDMSDIGRGVASSIESNFADSFMSFVNGTQSAGDAFRNFAASVLSDASRMFAQKAIQSLLGQFSFANTSTNNLGGYVPKFARGGMVPALLTGGEYVFSPQAAKSVGPSLLKRINAGAAKGFAGGGMVYGGSGVRDDVPAMVPSGSFVVRKSAVQRYGGGYLSALANNRVQKRFWGGALLGSLLGAGIGYATGGKKGALIGAGIGFVGGGLAQNFAKTGDIFKSGGKGSGFFSFARQTPVGTAGAGAFSTGDPYLDIYAKSGASNAGSVAGFGSGVGKQATLNAALKQSLVGLGASAALALIAKSLGPKANKPWKDSQITPNRLAMERAQQSGIDSRGDGNIVMMEQNPQGGYSLVGYGQTPATRRFAEGGMVTNQCDGMRPYADGGFVGGMPATPISSEKPSNVNINIEINDNRTSASSSSEDQGLGNQDFSKRLSEMVRAETAAYIQEERRVGGTLRNMRGR